jgi:hypothetical protein
MKAAQVRRAAYLLDQQEELRDAKDAIKGRAASADCKLYFGDGDDNINGTVVVPASVARECMALVGKWLAAELDKAGVLP